MDRQVELLQLRAPLDHGATLIHPPPDEWLDLVEGNEAGLNGHDYDVQGRCLAELAAAARRELVERARAYTAAYRDVSVPGLEDVPRIFLAGHQPELFHPGVWLKNFLLGRFAQQHGGIGINLLIDSDTIDSPSIRVPGGTVDAPMATQVFMDRAERELPYAERTILDRDRFVSFGRRAAETIRPLVRDPLMGSFWPLAVGRAEVHGNLGLCLAQARHTLEGQWGLATLEIPQGQVCTLDAFYWFAAHLLANLPRFWELYNETLRDFRRVNRVRSRSHPVPDLAARGGWLEAPFWVWTRDDPRRRALFARPRGDQIVLADLQGFERAVTLTPDGDAEVAVGQLRQMTEVGIRFRTRATLTTMFARVFLCDAFLHGIGGAKYDGVTDELIRRFLGLQPPSFVVASATLHLPIRRPHVTVDDDLRLSQMLRELDYHPERYVEATDRGAIDSRAELARLIAKKRRWIETPKTHQNARARHVGITEANASLQSWIEPLRLRLMDERRRVVGRLRSESILGARDYAFCLYPEETLRELLESISNTDRGSNGNRRIDRNS